MYIHEMKLQSITDKIYKYIDGKRSDSSYYGDKSVQVVDLLRSTGDLEAFCRGNAIKYISRWGKKGDGKNMDDLFKAIHYIVILMEEERDGTR
jgi:hypothetical protein|tara:strand:+ start:710 stop:988 length:279 start_codon:yes stop_codon:yes gene_type:complete